MKKLILILLYGFLILHVEWVFSASWSIDIPIKAEKIRDMQENEEALIREKDVLEFKWKTFKIWNESLSDLIIELSDDQTNEVEEIIDTYNEQEDKLRAQLNKMLKYNKDLTGVNQELLDIKQELYTNLLPYIKTDYTQEYKNYIISDIALNEKSKKVDTEIQQISVKKKERIEEIEEKIEDNNKVLRKNIEEKIKQRITYKLDAFTKKEDFIALDNESKILIFERLIDKIDTIKDSYKISENSTSILEEKIFLLEVIEEIFNEYIKSWK